MRKMLMAALLAGSVALGTAASAQAPAQSVVVGQPISGTRLDFTAIGEVTRVPDIAVVSAGVTTRSATAGGAIGEAAARMARVRAQLKSAGVADRDIQTSTISLNPNYVYEDNKPPRLTGYTASNQLSVRFRNIADAGKIIDALVAVGANQINGPTLTLDHPEAALDEARIAAVAAGRARAQLYAQALGMRVVRVVAVSEGGGFSPPPPMPVMMAARAESADSKIDPGEQKISVSVTMTFELQ